MHTLNWMILWFNGKGLQNNSRYHIVLHSSTLLLNEFSFFCSQNGLDSRTDNRVMTKQWHWMRHFVQLLSMGCLQLVVGDWALTGSLCCLLIRRTLRLVPLSVSIFSVFLLLLFPCVYGGVCAWIFVLFSWLFFSCLKMSYCWLSLTVCWLLGTGSTSLPGYEASRRSSFKRFFAALVFLTVGVNDYFGKVKSMPTLIKLELRLVVGVTTACFWFLIRNLFKLHKIFIDCPMLFFGSCRRSIGYRNLWWQGFTAYCSCQNLSFLHQI